MRIAGERFVIRLPRPFRIAHGACAVRETLLVQLLEEQTGAVGFGEGALVPYYPSTAQACLRWLGSLCLPENLPDSPPTEIPEAPPEAAAARAAVDIAWHDLWGKRSALPLWRLWNLTPANCPPCAWTIPIAENETDLAERLEEARGAPLLKLKAGSGDRRWDEACFAAAREAFPSALIGVDANGGWSPEEAGLFIRQTAPFRPAFIEEPVVPDGWRELRSRLRAEETPPLIADESVQGEADIAAFAGLADGINVKTLKAGGLSGARRWIAGARRLGLRVMVGVMVETGIGRSAAAQLAPLADWLDIDSPLAIPAGPRIGFQIEEGRLVLSERPGLGLTEVASCQID